MGLGPTVGKGGPLREKKGSGALTRRMQRYSARHRGNNRGSNHWESDNRESACADRIPAVGGRLGDAGPAIVPGPAGDRRGCSPGAFRIAPGKGMVLSLVPAGRSGRHRVLGPYSAPGSPPAAVWDEVRAMARGR